VAELISAPADYVELEMTARATTLSSCNGGPEYSRMNSSNGSNRMAGVESFHSSYHSDEGDTVGLKDDMPVSATVTASLLI
jgi:hypothetical protein